MKVYRSGRVDARGRQRGGWLRRVLLVLLLLVIALLVYVLVPFGSQRAVLLGSDARAEEASRSDTIVVLKAGGGALAVPRDTLVEIPGVGEDKVNAAFATGGPDLTVETLEGLTDLPIDHYVVVDFNGVQEIVDALGGITVNVEQPIEYTLDGRPVSIPAGTQELDGAQALGFVRFRGDPTADIGRIGRQQEFLRAFAAEASSPGNLPRLPATAGAVWRNIETDMNPIQALRFAAQTALLGLDGGAEIYPGTPQYIGGISYWVPDTEAGAGAVDATIR
jgi:polyisoprenyl-teichoic acid--peptidoglycan teichoic acid transferase